MMAQNSGGKSNLNPNAPLFVPASFRQVEDFSTEWWQLITTSTWYREYWLNQHEGADGFYNNPEDDSNGSDIISLLPDNVDLVAGEDPTDFDLQYEEFVRSNEAETENRPSYSPSAVDIAELQLKNLNLLQSSPKSSTELAKYTEKPVKDSSPKCVSSSIQQSH